MKVSLLKIAALFSYCGGPLFIADMLKRRHDSGWNFVITFAPVLLMVFGAFCVDDTLRSRGSAWCVWAGLQGLYVVAAMNVYMLWRFSDGVRVPDQSLHYIGVTVGVVWGVVYWRAARRWPSPFAGASRSADPASAEPIEPS